MLPSQVRAIDLNRPGTREPISAFIKIRRARATRSVVVVGGRLVLTALILISVGPAFAAKQKGKKQKLLAATPTPSASAGEQSLTNIPLPIGHEAKGLVLPDFDSEGHLRGRFEAARAKRLDEEHVGFQSLKIVTYTPDNKVDLTIDLIESVLDLKTRILTSDKQSKVTRADFNIIGDSVQFDTNDRTGKMIGNVKMVISDRSHLMEKEKSKE